MAVVKTVRVDQLADEIANAIRTYTEDVTKGIEKELNSTSRRVLNEIKAKSPRNTGEYASGWTRRKISSGGEINYIIYNRKKGSIAHLLEFGHAKRGGGRVAAIPHMRPAYDKEIPGMERRIKTIIGKGG